MKKFMTVSVVIALVVTMWGSAAFSAESFQGKKILFVDSYHEGYAWSDGITKGVQDALAGKGIELKIARMDTKRNTTEEFKEQAALKVKEIIEQFKPDVVIAADDNASKYLVMKYYRNAALPFVFCGVNWDAGVYGYPYRNATGMVEVTPVPQIIDFLKKYAKGDRIGFLAPDILTAKKESDQYKNIFKMQLVEYYAADFDDWKKGFVELQAKADMLIIDSDGGLYSDHAEEMKSFVEKNSKIPSGSCYDFMTPYALISYAKVAEEQGFWSANAALEILGGTSPSAIPITQNKEGSLIINVRIAKAIGADIPYDVLSTAARVIE